MSFNFINITPGVIQAADKKPGHSDVALFAPTGDFTDLKIPVAPFNSPGDSKKITLAHTFPTGKGFSQVQAKANSIDPTGDAAGEAGGQVPSYKYKVIIKGDSAEILEWLENVLNEDSVWLFNSPLCGVDEYIQIGGKCSPANISGFAFRGGNKGAGGFKEYEFIVTSSDKFFYSGAVTKKPVVANLSVLTQPAPSTSVAVGAPATITGAATGGQTPYLYQWVKGSLPGTNVSGATAASLVIGAAALPDENIYTLKITDSSAVPQIVYTNTVALFVNA